MHRSKLLLQLCDMVLGWKLWPQNIRAWKNTRSKDKCKEFTGTKWSLRWRKITGKNTVLVSFPVTETQSPFLKKEISSSSQVSGNSDCALADSEVEASCLKGIVEQRCLIHSRQESEQHQQRRTKQPAVSPRLCLHKPPRYTLPSIANPPAAKPINYTIKLHLRNTTFKINQITNIITNKHNENIIRYHFILLNISVKVCKYQIKANVNKGICWGNAYHSLIFMYSWIKYFLPTVY